MTETTQTGRQCLNCGLPLVDNHHPKAGLIPYLNIVGAPSGCLPCTEKRANGRYRLYCDMLRWLDDGIIEAEIGQNRVTAKTLTDVKHKLMELDNARQEQYRKIDF